MFKTGITIGEMTTTTSMRLHSFCSILLVGLIGLVLPAFMGGRCDDCAHKTKMNLTHLPCKAPTTPHSKHVASKEHGKYHPKRLPSHLKEHAKKTLIIRLLSSARAKKQPNHNRKYVFYPLFFGRLSFPSEVVARPSSLPCRRIGQSTFDRRCLAVEP